MTRAPIRVAQVVGKMLGGGVESVVMNYYRHIDRSRVQFDFLVDDDSALVPREEIDALGGRMFEIPPYRHVLAYRRALVGLFCEQRWEIVHSHINTLSVFPLSAAKKAGVPIRIAHSHSTAGKGEHAKNALKYALRPFANTFPTHRFACSRYAGEWLFGKSAEFEVIYNAIELPRFAFDAEARSRVRSGLGIDGNQLAIGHVGRFMPQKNQCFLVESFALLLERRPDAVLLLVGEGEQRPLVEQLAAERGIADRVKFLGQRSDVAELYSAFDVFALPSLYEGLGIVAIEAQMAGLPCILSDAVPHEVDVTGKCWFLPIDDPAAWTDVICSLDACLYGRRTAIDVFDFKNYDIKDAARRLTEMYEQMAKGCTR